MYRVVVVTACFTLCLAGQTRRALIVGIDHYETHTAAAAPAPVPTVIESSRHVAGTVARPPATGTSRGSWHNLEGAVEDATIYRQILIDRYGFSPSNIVFLTDKVNAKNPGQVATAQHILDTFKRLLIDDAGPGDISVFIYAGHGSRMHNLGSDEPDKMDQTIVPADSEDGTPDIRDKELARLYRKAADKKVLLTIIADSCHSGGISRGAGIPAVTRDSPPDPHVVNDPPDIDPKTGKPFPDPATTGYVLVVSSALDNQAAEEMDVDGHPHGVFSYFFQRCLRAEPANEPIEEVFDRTVALMRAAGRMQMPGLEGTDRRDKSLLGTPASALSGIGTVVQGVDDEGKITLRGGLSLGLQQGCELVLNGNKNGTRIRIISPPTLSRAFAKVVTGPAPHPGDYFVLDRWTVPQDVATRFYLPSAGLPTIEQLRATAEAIRAAAANWHWIQDPTRDSPAVVVRYDEGEWQIEHREGGRATRTSLGKTPSAAAWKHALAHPAGDLFVDFPPSREFVAAIKAKMEPGADAVQFVEHRPDALYDLVGRLAASGNGSDFEYAWVLANTDDRDEGRTPLPIRSDWFAAAGSNSPADLAGRTVNIARLRLWLQVKVPGGGKDPFPYTLALRNEKTGQLRTDGQIVEGDVYDLILTSTPEKLKAASADAMPQWVYVAAIDQQGRMRPIFPRQLINTSANQLPRDGAPAEITLRPGIPVGAPYGTDTLLLLTSETPLDPAVLQIDAVMTRGASHTAPKGSVSNLLFQMQHASRGLGDDAPSDWDVERLTFHSVRKTK
jgi:Caspase domain